MEGKDKIAKAIISVMKEVKGMEKNSRIGKGENAYDGTKDQDVKEIFNKALTVNGLCILPIGIDKTEEISRYQDRYGNQKQSVFTSIKTKYLLLHDSGQSVELAGYGQGVDSQDKGAGKATTYALKNCLLLTFLTPVGKMLDTDLTPSVEMEVIPEAKTVKPKIVLKKDTPEWTAIICALADKTLDKTIADVKVVYIVTAEQEQEIMKEVLLRIEK